MLHKVSVLYCLGNNEKKKSLYMFNTDAIIIGITTYKYALATA